MLANNEAFVKVNNQNFQNATFHRRQPNTKEIIQSIFYASTFCLN